jgi:hypothetical protein
LNSAISPLVMMRSDHGVNEAVRHQIAFESRQESRQKA